MILREVKKKEKFSKIFRFIERMMFVLNDMLIGGVVGFLVGVCLGLDLFD